MFFFFWGKGAISESQIAFVSLSLNSNTGNISTYIHRRWRNIHEEIIYLLLFTLDRENCLMNVSAADDESFWRRVPKDLFVIPTYASTAAPIWNMLYCGTWLNGNSEWHSKWGQEGVNSHIHRELFIVILTTLANCLFVPFFNVFAVSSWQSDKYFDRHQTQKCHGGKFR